MKILVASLSILISSFAFSQQEALGKWITVDDKTGVRKTIVEVYKRENRYYGKVIRMLYRDQNEKCSRCEGELKDKPVVGMDIISGMSYRKRSDDFDGGSVLNPESGKTYNGKMWVEDGKLMVRGYLFFFHRTQAWEPYLESSLSGEQ